MPIEVPEHIEELCEEIAVIPDKGENIIKTAAYLHLQLKNCKYVV
ncbi:hypothetical protein CE91St56_22900 [Lachnospiraceae bacterium]|nr:hypothetical protein CE91St56_22900 [Lachnospiraceae bacterium]GKH41234.1 hypothetical protein CE91St57_22080 [Lachnospiraceae bacterium]